MPFFSFSLSKIPPSLKKFNITANNLYFSKNTQLWNILNKLCKSNINSLEYEKRNPIKNTGKKILFCLPPSIGLGDAVEYASAIKTVSDSNIFQKVAVAFGGEYVFLFKNYFNLENNFSSIISKVDMMKFDTIFHLTLEIKSLINQKYSRSDIYTEIINYFKLQDIKNKIIDQKTKSKIKQISIFPLSNSPIRTMPIELIYYLTKNLTKYYNLEIFLNNESQISNQILKKLRNENIRIIDPKSKKELISAIEKIEYGVFMDSGPLHVAKMFNKRGVLIETSVSSKILLKNYKLIKGIKNSFLSHFCVAPCGLTDIFNYNNKHGCFDSLKIKSANLKADNYKNIMSRGVKNHYMKNFIEPVGCVSSLNIQNIYNTIINDLSICEES